MDLFLRNKKILVTGGSRGIGLACAKVLAQEGANIIISSRDEKNLDQALRQFGEHTGDILSFPADLTSSRSIDSLVDFVIHRFGHIDCLLLNTGGPPMGKALEHSDKVWQEAVDSLLISVVRLTRHFVPVMQKRKFGRIINISSTGVKQPIPGLVLSNSVRQAVGAYLKTLSSEVAENNVFINSLLPGSTNTGRLDSLHESIANNTGKTIDEVIAGRKKNIPAGRFAEPEHLANIAAFLLSEKNAYITGQSIAVDGGMVTFPL